MLPGAYQSGLFPLAEMVAALVQYQYPPSWKNTEILKTMLISQNILRVLEFGKLEVLWNFEGIGPKEGGIMFPFTGNA